MLVRKKKERKKVTPKYAEGDSPSSLLQPQTSNRRSGTGSWATLVVDWDRHKVQKLMQRMMKSTGSTQSWLTLKVTILWLFATVVLVDSSNTCLGVSVSCVRTKQATIVPDLLEFIV